MTKLAVFAGSLRQTSYNRMLANSLENLAPEGVEFHYVNLHLPLFNQDLEKDFPAEAQTVKDIVEACDGVLFVTPEYNRGVPGVLKNAIDWVSRPYGANSFAGKPVGVVGASIGPVGTAVAQSDLHHILAYLDMKLLGQPEVYVGYAAKVFSADGELVSDPWRENLKTYIATFAEWVQKA